MRVKKNKKKLSDLDNYLESLAVSGDFMRAAGSAGVSVEQLEQWFNDPLAPLKIVAARTKDPEIYQMIEEARKDPEIRRREANARKVVESRFKAQLRKNLRALLMEPAQFAEALRYCYNCSTKRRRRNDTAIINLLIKNPRISNEDGAHKLKIKVSAFKMRKRRFFEAFFERLTIR